jgi:hypothetical protein
VGESVVAGSVVVLSGVSGTSIVGFERLSQEASTKMQDKARLKAVNFL